MKKYVCGLLLLFSFVYCKKTITESGDVLNVKFYDQDKESEGTITSVDAYAFTGDVLVNKYSDVKVDENGSSQIVISDLENEKLLFLVNGRDISIDPVDIGKTSYSNMMYKTTPIIDYKTTQPSLFYTASHNLPAVSTAETTVQITRSLARLDLHIQPETDIVIDSCVIYNVVDRSYVFQSNKSTHPDAKLLNVSLESPHFTATSTAPQNGFFFLYESDAVGSKIIFYAKINGAKNKLEVLLPSKIERNNKIRITINNRGAALYSTLVVLPWTDGPDLDATPDVSVPLIDVVNSDFPSTVSFSKSKDTLFIPANCTSGILAIDSSIGTELMTDTNIVIEPVIESRKSTYVGNKFTLTLPEKDLGAPLTYDRIYIKDKSDSNSYEKCIVIVHYPFRTSFSDLNENGEIAGPNVDFNGYSDGKIANLTFSEEPVEVICKSSDPDFNWMTIDRTEPSLPEIHGFFKPNDAGAHGQTQESIIKVTYSDGWIEEFKFTRKRESMPSVFLAGRHWAKHNLRGNSKKYEDQISIAKDKDIDDTFEFLKTCSDEDYIYYSGANYKGRSQEGMYLHHDIVNNVLNYDGYSQYPNADLSNVSPYLHCPKGYQIPTLKDIGTILHETGRFGLPADCSPVEYTSNASVRFSIERHKRASITIDGIEVPNVFHTVITDTLTHVSLTLAGMGHQFDLTNISYHSVIMGIINPNGAKYFTFDHTGNYATIQSHNSTKTRVIRCIKSPVKHLIEE